MQAKFRPDKLTAQAAALCVDWADGHRSRFHHIWLRDACRCTDCGEPSFGDKRIVLSELPDALRLRAHYINNNGAIVVTWDHDGHESVFSGEWLRRRCYSKTERAQRRFRPVLWHAGAPPDVSPFALPELLGSDDYQYKMLERLHRYGIVFVDQVPADTGVRQVGELIGFLRETNYGDVYDIKVEPVPRTFADLPQLAPLHTDDAFRPFPPGLTMLHCVQPSIDGGGASLFLDGFEVVEQLRLECPAAVELLSRLPLRFSRHHPDEHDFVFHGKLIRLDPEGHVASVRLGLHNISPPDIDEDEVEAFYDALKRIDRLVRTPASRIVRRLAAGDLALVDNERVLHGRDSFDGSGGRHIRGAFVERDAFHSRWRVLSERLGYEENKHLVFPGGR